MAIRKYKPTTPGRRGSSVSDFAEITRDHPEKSYGLIEDNVYTFVVAPGSNKTQIKIAIEKIFKVKVDSVNTLNRQGKRKRTRAGYGQRKSTKRALVTLAPGSKPIDLFGAPA